uniref:hypothetical protein n=1 Tax=Clostridium sp. NkU-1 TaxID=1095009 RepID=UPI00326115B1
MIVAVDETIDPSDSKAVWQEVLRYAHPEEDFVVSKGPLDALDHSSDYPLYGGRLGIDATSRGKEPLPGDRLRSWQSARNSMGRQAKSPCHAGRKKGFPYFSCGRGCGPVGSFHSHVAGIQ